MTQVTLTLPWLISNLETNLACVATCSGRQPRQASSKSEASCQLQFITGISVWSRVGNPTVWKLRTWSSRSHKIFYAVFFYKSIDFIESTNWHICSQVLNDPPWTCQLCSTPRAARDILKHVSSDGGRPEDWWGWSFTRQPMAAMYQQIYCTILYCTNVNRWHCNHNLYTIWLWYMLNHVKPVLMLTWCAKLYRFHGSCSWFQCTPEFNKQISPRRYSDYLTSSWYTIAF